MSSFPRLHKRRLKRHLLRNRTQRSTAIRGSVMLSPAITENITTPPRLTLPTAGRANFYISNSSDLRFGRLEAFAFSQDGVVRDERNLVMRLCISDQARGACALTKTRRSQTRPARLNLKGG